MARKYKPCKYGLTVKRAGGFEVKDEPRKLHKFSADWPYEVKKGK